MRVLCVGELVYYDTEIRYFNNIEVCNFDSDDILVYIGRRKRIFYKENDSIYSMHFPFEIICCDEMYKLTLNRVNNDLQKEISVLLTILNPILKDDFNSELKCNRAVEEYFQDNYLELDDELFNNCRTIIDLLFNVDYGYLRYDYDTSGKKGHPKNHIDIYYDDIIGIKIALNCNNSFGFEDMINICNIYNDDFDVGYEIKKIGEYFSI